MAATHILYLTNACLVSLVARGGQIVERAVFPASGAGRDAFERRVRELRKIPTHLLTDLAEEDFRLDTIPHLRPGDRQAVLSRRLSQIFRSTPYRHAITQGREPEGRRDDRVIYTAITNPEILRPWTEVLERLQVPFEGIHSSAVFSGRLLAELGLAFPHTLLVTFTPGGAVRQTYFRDREIKFSRLTPVDLAEGDTLGSLLSGETARTWQYLDSLRYFAPSDRLEVCVIVHPKDRSAIDPVLRDFDQILYRVIDMEAAASRLGMRPAPASSNAEELLAHLAAKVGLQNHFAPPELRKHAVLRRARIVLNSAALAIVGGSLAYGGWNLSLAMQNREKDLISRERVSLINRQHDDVIRSMPLQAVGGHTMRDAVALYTRWLQNYPTVGAFLQPLSTVLDRYPAIRLTQVAWQAGEDDRVTPAVQPMSSRAPPPVKAQPAGKEAPKPASGVPADAPNAPFPSGRAAVALLEGTVGVTGLGFRDALGQLDRLVADIGRIEGYRAVIVDSPLDVTPKTSLQGRFDDRSPAPSQARFAIKVTRVAGSRS